MALRIEEMFEGSNGAALTTGNTSFDTVDGSATFSTSVFKQGASSALFSTSSAYLQCIYSTTNVTTAYWSFYIYPTAAPSANTVILYVGASSATRTFQVVFNTTRTVKLQNTSAIIIGSNTSSTLPLNEWSRIDVQIISGTVTMSIYPGNANCDNATGTAGGGDVQSGAAGATAVTYRYCGIGNATTNSFYLDAFREDDSALPGPVSAGSTDHTATPSDTLGLTDIAAAAKTTVWPVTREIQIG